MTATIFEQIITGEDVEDAVEDTLQTWLVTYLAEIERQKGLTAHSLPMVRSWQKASHLGKFDENQTPAILIVTPGMSPEKIKARAAGTYDGCWAVGVAAVVSARDEQNTNRLAKLYTAAIREAILQHKGLGGFAESTEWVAPYEAYDDIRFDQGRTLRTGRVYFDVKVSEVTTSNAGPRVVPDDPYVAQEEWPPVLSVDETIEKESI